MGKTTMARSRQFIDGWRHAERSLIAWLYTRSQSMGDLHAKSLLNAAADDFGKWAKGRYCTTEREGTPRPEDPLAVFRAAVRREALEEAARIVEDDARDAEQGVIPAEFQHRKVADAIRAAMSRDGNP
jgi:hypothetical protein